MTMSGRALLMLLALTAPVANANAQQPSLDRRVSDIVQAGKIRVGLHLPQFVKDPTSGEIHGHGTGKVIVAIAQALGTQLGVKLELVGHPSPPKLIECLQAQACDAGFLGFVPGRTGDVGFTPPYIMVPFTLMVPASSSIRNIADVDKAGIRIAAVRNHASTLALRRVVKRAEIVADRYRFPRLVAAFNVVHRFPFFIPTRVKQARCFRRDSAPVSAALAELPAGSAVRSVNARAPLFPRAVGSAPATHAGFPHALRPRF